jgi:hypothetical protein
MAGAAMGRVGEGVADSAVADHVVEGKHV